MATKKELESEIAIYRDVILRIHEALKPSIRLWQKETGQPLTWPDTVEHIKWLVKRVKDGK